MKIHSLVLLCAFLGGAASTLPQPGTPNWLGVWQGQLDGLPCVVLTLAEDSGTLEGTLFLNIITRDNGSPHIVAREAHVMLRTHTQRDTLTFQVKRIDRSAPPMDFTVQQTSQTTATMHCLNCGDAPTIEITRLD